MNINIETLCKKISNTPILVVGDVMLDEFVYGTVKKISPESPVPILEHNTSKKYIGGAANVAANISSLVGKTYLLGIIGNDDIGNSVRELLKEHSINWCGISYSGRTIHKKRYMSDGIQLLRVDNDVKYSWGERDFVDSLNKLPERPKCVIISDYNKGTISPEVCRCIKQYCNTYNIPMLIDPKPRKYDTEMYRGVKLIKPNRIEAEQMTNRKLITESDFLSSGKYLVKKYNSNVLITLDKDGMFLFNKDGTLCRYKVKPMQSPQVSGAGDTIIAVIALGVANKLSLEESCELANYAGQAVIKLPGTSTVSWQDISNINYQCNL